MPGLFSRNSRVSATNAGDDKLLAKNYAREIWVIGAELKAARLEYKLRVVRNSPQAVLTRVTDDFNNIVLRWPYYDGTPQNRRVDSEGRYPENAQPYPSKSVISKYIGMVARKKIIKVALLARLGVKEDSQRFQGLLPTINAMADVNEFMRSIKKYLNIALQRIHQPVSSIHQAPPAYNVQGVDVNNSFQPVVYGQPLNAPPLYSAPSAYASASPPPSYSAGNGRRKTRRVRRRKARKTRKH
jgi:hypothetical protein